MGAGDYFHFQAQKIILNLFSEFKYIILDALETLTIILLCRIKIE